MKIKVKGVEIVIYKIDLDLIRDYKWSWNGGRLRAWVDGKKQFLHRMIAERMGLNPDKWVFRKNNNRFDFRRSNLIDISPLQESIRENALIDERNMDLIEKYNWCFNGKGYLVAWVNGKQRFLHQLIAERMGFDLSNDIDHIDRNPLNNRESNLRSATNSQNQMNKKRQSNNTSGYIGVSYHKASNKWRAYIKVKNKQTYLGCFDDPIEAAHTRDRPHSSITANLPTSTFQGKNNDYK